MTVLFMFSMTFIAIPMQLHFRRLLVHHVDLERVVTPFRTSIFPYKEYGSP